MPVLASSTFVQGDVGPKPCIVPSQTNLFSGSQADVCQAYVQLVRPPCVLILSVVCSVGNPDVPSVGNPDMPVIVSQTC